MEIPKNKLKEYGLKCKNIRVKYGYTQKEFAEKIGKSQAEISAFENGRRNSFLMYMEYRKLYFEHIERGGNNG